MTLRVDQFMRLNLRLRDRAFGDSDYLEPVPKLSNPYPARYRDLGPHGAPNVYKEFKDDLADFQEPED